MTRGTRFCLLLLVTQVVSCSDGLECGPGTAEQDGRCLPASGDAGQSGPDANGGSGDKRVFVTRTAYNADLGGLAGADDKCQTAADSFDLGGTWVAWLSAEGTDALDRVTGSGPWLDLTGATIFTNRAMLMTQPLSNIVVQENGEALTESDVWTGTQTGGVGSTSHCESWTRSDLLSGGLYGDFDDSGATDNWTSTGFLSDCGEDKRLYCFEL